MTRPSWTAHELERLKALWNLGSPSDTIAEALPGRSIAAIEVKASKLKLPRRYKASPPHPRHCWRHPWGKKAPAHA